MPKSPYARYGVTAISGTQQSQHMHTVRAGETIQAIQCSEYLDAGYDQELWRQVAEYNNIDDLDSLTAGTVLIMPAAQPPST